MTITLYLQKETLLRDLQTLRIIFQYNIEMVERLRKYYTQLDVSTTKRYSEFDVAIQVTPEEFALIGIFNEGI